jgi:serine/threonine protein kinase
MDSCQSSQHWMGGDHGFRLEDYDMVKLVGRGRYAVVELWKRRKDGNVNVGRTDGRNIDNSVFPMVAIKRFISYDQSRSDLVRTLAVREASFLGEVQHENIVKFISHIEHDGNQCLVLEYVPQTLAALLDSAAVRHKNSALAIKLVGQLVSGLQYLHSRNMVHGDIKASNLLVTSDGVLKICDFGHSFKSSDPEPGRRSWTAGTRGFRAPEILLQDPRSDWHVDIWSVGCVASLLLNLEHAVPSVGVELPALHELWSPAHEVGCLDSYLKQLLRETLGKGSGEIPQYCIKYGYEMLNDENTDGKLMERMIDLTNDCKSFISSCLQMCPKRRPPCSELLQRKCIKEAFAAT